MDVNLDCYFEMLCSVETTAQVISVIDHLNAPLWGKSIFEYYLNENRRRTLKKDRKSLFIALQPLALKNEETSSNV